MISFTFKCMQNDELCYSVLSETYGRILQISSLNKYKSLHVYGKMFYLFFTEAED